MTNDQLPMTNVDFELGAENALVICHWTLVIRLG
jgi:hypothetical protein